MNRKTFYETVGYDNFGREIAYLNVSEVTPQNILPLVDKCIYIMRKNAIAIEYLWNYYKGDQPVLYREKNIRDDICNTVVENHAYEIVAFKNGQTNEEPIQFVSLRDDESVNKAVDELNDYIRDAFKHARDIEAGEWMSAVGTAYKSLQFAIGNDVPFRVVVPNPINTIVGYNSTTKEPLLALQVLKDEDSNEYIQVYTKTHECKVYGKHKSDKRIVDWKLHAYGDIPIIEYPNNSARISDIELVIEILDALNNIQSNRVDGIEQFVQSWIKFVNCEIDQASFMEMKKMGAMVVKSNNGDNKASVDIMSQELNQEQTQIAKKDLWDNALSILAIPNKQENSGGDTQGAVELRNGWSFSNNRTRMKDAIIKESEKKLGKIVLNILRISGHGLNISWRDYEANINHNPTDNIVVKCQSLQYLRDCGVHPLVAIKTVGLWGDAEKIYNLSKPYLDKVWKKLAEDGVDIDDQKKKAELFMEFLNAGFSYDEAAEKSDLKITGNKDGFAKWDYEPDEVIEVEEGV